MADENKATSTREEQDEALVGTVLTDLPAEALSDSNRGEYVRVLAAYIRTILSEMREVVEIGLKYAVTTEEVDVNDVDKLKEALEVINELDRVEHE
jgi:hypothetical protein